jgi:hypothetical protein
MRDSLPIVAHPYYNCGTRLVICSTRTGKCTKAIVADRGPRNATIDLSASLMRRIGHGMEPVIIIRLDQGDQHIFPGGLTEVDLRLRWLRRRDPNAINLESNCYQNSSP